MERKGDRVEGDKNEERKGTREKRQRGGSWGKRVGEKEGEKDGERWRERKKEREG